MEVLVNSGKVIYIGSSNFAAWNIAQANGRAEARGFLGLVSEQSKYSLLVRDIELEVVPACRDYRVGILCSSPLGGGALAGSLRGGSGGRREGTRISDHEHDRLAKYYKLCDELTKEPANVALAWLLHNPVVTAPIIGPRTVEQLESAFRAVEISLDADVMSRLDSPFPGPGDQAPEAYAW